MRHPDSRDRAVGRVRRLRTGLVAGAAAGSLGLAVVIGLSAPGRAAATNRSTSVSTGTTRDDSGTVARPNRTTTRHHAKGHHSVTLSTGTGQTQATTSGS